MPERTAWQVSVLAHLEHIGPFICGIHDSRVTEAVNRDYRSFHPDRAEMFEELDALVDEGLAGRRAVDEGIVYYRLLQCSAAAR